MDMSAFKNWRIIWCHSGASKMGRAEIKNNDGAVHTRTWC